MEYLIILICLLLITALLHWRFHIKLYTNRRHAFATIGILLVIGIAWDSLAISRGHWLFPVTHNSGWILGNMPLEEYFFMLIQPYFVLVIYSCIKKITHKT